MWRLWTVTGGGGCSNIKETRNPTNSSNKPEYYVTSKRTSILAVRGREVLDRLRPVIESAEETDAYRILVRW
jgi:hypothetical protein